MIEFKNIEKYKENNRIEAKRALGGLPHSIWETYSAFANTLGGIILLGVEEHTDKTLHPIKLPDPEGLCEDFWDMVNDPKKVSANILSEDNITIENIDGKSIVAIRVPRARRADKPVYIEGNPFQGSYRRNGEGDYKCTKEEVFSMMRDAAIKTQDMTVIERMNIGVLSYDSVIRYQNAMPLMWEDLPYNDLLYKLGAIAEGEDRKMHPTAAGLLMFGYECEIVKEYPQYFLDYCEYSGNDNMLTYRITSSSGDWSGNICDFYFKIRDRITMNPESGDAYCDDVCIAIKEAVANCLINADYLGKQGIVIVKTRDMITISNPGSFLIDLEAAKNGGVSDPRNSALVKMFNLMNVGKRMGSGIPNMFAVWKKQGWCAPIISESFDPDRITLYLAIGKTSKNNSSENEAKNIVGLTSAHRQAIIAYLTEKVIAKDNEIADLLGLDYMEIQKMLDEMTDKDIIVAEHGLNGCLYKLKA